MKLLLLLLPLFTFVRSLDFLEDPSLPMLEFDFSVSCGNSHVTKSKISMDIILELRKSGYTKFEYQITSHSSKEKEIEDLHFKIFLIKTSEKILLATSNNSSEKYQPLLDKYPSSLYIGNKATEEEKKTRIEFIKNILEQVKSIQQ